MKKLVRNPILRIAATIACASIVITVVALARVGTTSGAGQRPQANPIVDIPKSLNLRMKPSAVANIVQAVLPDAQIERITARRWASEIHYLEPGAGTPTFGHDFGPVWIVRARGAFVSHFPPPGQSAVTSPTGYLLVADSTGAVFGMGLP